MEQLRVNRVRFDRIEPSNPHPDRKGSGEGEAPRDDTRGDEHAPPDELAMVLRQHHLVRGDLRRTRARVFQHPESGEVMIDVTDASTGEPIGVFALAELTRLGGGAEAVRGLLIERRT